MDLFFKNNIQVRPIWYPNHLQKKMRKFQRYNLTNYKNFHDNHICLPSGYGLKNKEIKKILDTIYLIDKKLNSY